jgi:hypothetical protein
MQGRVQNPGVVGLAADRKLGLPGAAWMSKVELHLLEIFESSAETTSNNRLREKPASHISLLPHRTTIYRHSFQLTSVRACETARNILQHSHHPKNLEFCLPL